ncbi:MAG: helix-turn-helix domain-containing protein [Candidatus Uhrbacteria bacterium]|nr:helix-turn-helix domain-containing protein [Candidatus Uhrbacteria bacterium]
MIDELKVNLMELGLGQKEADVYLAMLQLGPSSVQEIADASAINRSTIYPVIDELQHRGLASTFEKGKKVLFAAENPQRLVSLVVHEFSHIEAKRNQLEISLPKLLAVFNTRNDKPRVRFFEGEEALEAVRDEVHESRDAIWEVYAVNERLIHIANTKGKERIERNRRAIGGRALMAIKPGCMPPYFDIGRHEARVMNYEQYPFSGDIAMTGNHLYVVSMEDPIMGIVVESKEMTSVFRALFEAAWSCAAAWMPPPGWGPPK